VRRHRSRWVLGLMTGLALGLTSCGSAAPSPSASGTASPSASAMPTGSTVAQCRNSQLKVTLVLSGVATGHVAGFIGFTNRGNTSCGLVGWPTVIAVTAAGKAIRAASVLTTFFGPSGLTAPPAVTIMPGVRAEAVVAGADFPVRGSSCPPPYRRLRITAPGSDHATVISAWLPNPDAYLPSCEPLSVSPVVVASALP
jgi:hypothetical protein